MKRCEWPQASQLETVYHDQEWGVPSYDDAYLYEMLTLEGAQAGLSWSTILAKREGYRRLFAQFDAAKVARFSEKRINKLLQDPSIVRHRGKIESTVSNAKAVLSANEEFGTLADLLWSFVDGQPVINHFKKLADVPAETATSKAMSKELKRRGFRFLGPTTCYAFMQAVGMVNDHTTDCFRWAELAAPVANQRFDGGRLDRRTN